MVMSSAATWLYGQQQRTTGAGMLPSEDYLEILQLYGYYTRDTDVGSQREASRTYT